MEAIIAACGGNSLWYVPAHTWLQRLAQFSIVYHAHDSALSATVLI